MNKGEIMNNKGKIKGLYYDLHSVLRTINLMIETNNHSTEKGLNYSYGDDGYDLDELMKIRTIIAKSLGVDPYMYFRNNNEEL